VTCLEAPLGLVAGQVFNAGDDESNLTLRELGELVAKLVPGTQVCEQQNSVDRRSYRVDFAKIRHELGFRCLTTVEKGMAEMAAAIRAGGFPQYEDVKYNNAAHLKSAGKQLLTNGLAHQKYRVIRIDKPSAEEVGNNGSTAAPHLEALTK